MGHLGTTSLLLSVDGIDYSNDVSLAVILSAPDERFPNAHWTRPEDVDVRPRRHSLSMTAAQDAAGNALWTLGWGRHGEQVDFHLAPYGNLIASETEPHYAGTVWVIQPDGELLGGAANPSRKAVMTVQMIWPADGAVEQLLTGTYPATLPEE